jgi:peptide/nickel transport system ATP-binding protein
MDSIFDHQPGCSVSTAEAKVCELLELVRLDPARILPAYPHQLSGGMRQRAVIAMSLVLDPELIILDEPTTALDTITQSYVFDILQNIHKTRALSMIFITHDMAAAARLSRNMMVMYGGRIMEVNKTSAVFLGAVHPYTRGLIDSTPFIDSEVSAKKPISGAPPDLLNPPSGCLFHPRCPDVKPICREKKPELNNYNQVLSCCHFPGRGNNE